MNRKTKNHIFLIVMLLAAVIMGSAALIIGDIFLALMGVLCLIAAALVIN